MLCGDVEEFYGTIPPLPWIVGYATPVAGVPLGVTLTGHAALVVRSEAVGVGDRVDVRMRHTVVAEPVRHAALG